MSEALSTRAWAKVTLAECCEEIAERIDNPAESGFDQFVGLEHLESGETSIRNWGSTGDVTSSMKIFKAGDVIVARRNVYLRRAARADFDGVCSGDGIVLRSNPRVCLPELLPFLLNADGFWAYVTSQADGTMSKRITVKRLLSYEFALPPLEEQRQIAEALEATETLFATLNEANAAAERVRGSLAAHFIFGSSGPAKLEALSATDLPAGWSLTPASELCSALVTKGATPTKELTEEDTGIPFLKVYNLTFDGRLDFTVRPTYVTETGHHELRRSSVAAGDVLMNIVGPPLGKVSLVPEDFPDANINQAIVRYRSTDPVLGAWISEYLLCPLAQSWLHARSKKTSGQRNLTLAVCRDLPVPVPPRSQLERIVSSLREVRQRAVKLKERASATRLLRQSLLSEALEVSNV